jgi:bacillithiol system protein YtxJ
MKWNELTTEAQLMELLAASEKTKILIFKHSTRCATSRLMLDRLQRTWNPDEMQSLSPYFLDLISFRQVSDAIAERLGVPHESPQVIMIAGGKAIVDWSHFEIDYQRIKEIAQN